LETFSTKGENNSPCDLVGGLTRRTFKGYLASESKEAETGTTGRLMKGRKKMRIVATFIFVLGLAGIAVPQKPVKDIQSDMLQTRQHLNAAKDLAYRAGNEWGGHRMNAMKHIDAALAEVDQAEKYAREHHYIK